MPLLHALDKKLRNGHFLKKCKIMIFGASSTPYQLKFFNGILGRNYVSQGNDSDDIAYDRLLGRESSQRVIIIYFYVL